MAPSPALAHRNRRLALLVLTLGVFLVTVNVTIVAVALPAIRADLPADATAAAWIVDGYTSSSRASSSPLGSSRTESAAAACSSRATRSRSAWRSVPSRRRPRR